MSNARIDSLISKIEDGSLDNTEGGIIAEETPCPFCERPPRPDWLQDGRWSKIFEQWEEITTIIYDIVEKLKIVKRQQHQEDGAFTPSDLV
jgi:hypothetical protein